MTTQAESPVALTVEAGDWPPEATLREIVGAALGAVSAKVSSYPVESEVSVLFTDDRHIAELNSRWRDKANPTNVLSFPAAKLGAGSLRPTLGDIVLGFETVTKEAAEADLTLADHITHLLVHGLLHLLGHDHEETRAAEAMETLETEILATLGIANPYADGELELTHTGHNS